MVIDGQTLNSWATWTAGLNTNLEYYYTLNETSGTTVIDSTGNLSGALVGGTVNVAGLIDKAHNYTGGKQGVSFNESYFDYNNPVTINTWVYWNQLEAKSIWTLGGGASGNLNLILLISGTKLQIGYLKDSVAWMETLQWATTPSVNQWYMVTVTQTSGQNLSMYINGTYIGSVTGTSTTASGISNVIANDFAAGPIGSTSPKAKFDETSFWSRVLTQAEITQLYNSGAGITYTNVFTTAHDCAFNGSVKTNTGVGVNGARVVITNVNSDTVFGNVTADANGLWNKNVTVDGNYSVYAYINGNITGGGDIKTYKECIRSVY